MIGIVNISPEDAPLTGLNRYEVRINKRVICTFNHDRQANGLAQCLRDAADQVEKEAKQDQTVLLNKLLQQLN